MKLPASAAAEDATLGRRLLSCVYETLLLAAVFWCAGLLYRLSVEGLGAAPTRAFFQVYLVIVAGVYFMWQWLHGGQTLAMKTWRLRLVSWDGGALSLRQALLRYVSAFTGLLLFGIGFVWPLFDRRARFLHDVIARTHIVRV